MDDLFDWEMRFEGYVNGCLSGGDAAHDMAHVRRVVATARSLAAAEGANAAVVIPAAWLHDCVIVPKDSPERSRASRLAAAAAAEFLHQQGYPAGHIPAIAHAIEAHSFSAGILPQSLEAKIVQDADRLDAIGAIGIARCLLLGGTMGKPLYNDLEPFPVARPADDSRYVLDHFYVKLLKLAEMMHTDAGRSEGRRRTETLHIYLHELEREIDGVEPPAPFSTNA